MKHIKSILIPLLGLVAIAAPAGDFSSKIFYGKDYGNIQAEIIQYYPKRRIVIANDDPAKRIHTFVLDPAGKELIKTGDFPMPMHPSSLAVFPGKPYVITVGFKDGGKGMLVVNGLGINNFGQQMYQLPVGDHPDSIAISPDGRFAVIACESEEHGDMRPSIDFIDLRELKAGTGGPKLLKRIDGVMLSNELGVPEKVIEPEFAAISPDSRMAAVSCQENNAVILFDTTGTYPKYQETVKLPVYSEPDGITLAGTNGNYLLGIAEEGGKINGNKKHRGGNAFSIYQVGFRKKARLLCRRDLRKTLPGIKPTKRIDPENVGFITINGKQQFFVLMERLDAVAFYDVTDLTNPRLLGLGKCGARPEGYCIAQLGNRVKLITGDEDEDGGTGAITVIDMK